MADIGQGKSCHVSIDDDKIMYGVFTEHKILEGYVIAATTTNNNFRVRKTLLIRNIAAIDPAAPNANYIFWGSSNVSPSNGVPIAPGESVTFDFTAKKWLDIFVFGAVGLAVVIAEFV